MIEHSVKHGALGIIEEATQRFPTYIAYSPVSGGCINMAGKLTTTAGPFFVKANKAEKSDMFSQEIRGLKELAQKSSFEIPKVVGFIPNVEGYGVLVLQWVEPQKKQPYFWENFAQQLSVMHRVSQDQFGFEDANYIGSLSQSNNKHEKWIDFFIEERIEKQLQLAEQKSSSAAAELRKKAERLYQKLQEIFPEEKPALLHGDLWSGNFIVGNKGEAVLVDPAVYYGNREMEIAFTGLFGGFPSSFYDAYAEAWPMEPGFQKRKDIYNLYPLLVHYNLFGSGYLTSIKLILKNF